MLMNFIGEKFDNLWCLSFELGWFVLDDGVFFVLVLKDRGEVVGRREELSESGRECIEINLWEFRLLGSMDWWWDGVVSGEIGLGVSDDIVKVCLMILLKWWYC